MRVLFALAFLLLTQAFLVSATIPEELYQKIEMIQNPKELRALEGIPEMFLQEKAYSAKDIGDLILQLQNDRAAFAKEVATSPLDQLITTLKSMLADEERQNVYARLVPQIRFQWVRTRDWIFLSTITINPQPYDERKPSVLVRTPYGPTTSNLADLYLLDGFVAVLQDQRGAFLSSGFYDFWRSDSADAYDTMEWIARQKWSNGRVYTAGISADGCSALTQPLFHPPWLKGQFIVWGSPEAYDSTYQGGAFRQSLIERWLTFIGITTRLHSWTVIDDVLAHESKDSYWDTLSLRDNDAYPNVDFPSVHYAGWYDIFQGPNIDAFNAYQYQSSSQGQHILYVDAGGHCVGSGDASFPHSFTTLPFKLSRDLFKSVEFGTSFNTTHKLILYILGTAFKDSQISSDVGNYWTTLPDWPKTSPTPFYLNVADSLTSSPPTQTGAFASFLYDPENPIRTPGGNNLAPPCGVHNLADVEQRDDVIVFTSHYLWEPVAVVGRIQAILYVSSNAIDTDFAAFLSDVNPDNSSALVQDGIIRMRWREGSVTPIYMETGVIYKVTVDLWYMAQVFNAGHRIRLSISSSNHPRFSVNRNNGRMVEDEGPYVQAINTIHFSPLHPSHLLLPVVHVADIPENPEIKKLYAVEPQL